MALVSALFTGVTGLTGNSQGLEVIGDNISNVNTVGFKSSRAVFGDVLSTVLTNGATNPQIGRGSQLTSILQSSTQGSFESSDNALDLAVDGSGFFIVNDGSGNNYTRAGQFRLNEAGLVQAVGGEILQGNKIDAGVTSTDLTDVDLAGVQSSPKPSTTFTLGTNLNAASSAGATFSSPITLYNSLGTQVILTMNFTKLAGSNSWNVTPTSSSGTVTSAASTTLTFDTTGQLEFISTTDETGSAATETPTDQTITLTFADNPQANTLNLTWDLANGDSGTNGKVTGFAAQSNNNSFVQDGFTTGTLIGLHVNSEGIIEGLFNNGQSENLFQVALADFLSPGSLTRRGANLFSESADAGQPIIGFAGSGGFGGILGSTLELSNVDLAAQFVNLIQTQQAFQASARIINTTDDLLTETVNLVR